MKQRYFSGTLELYGMILLLDFSDFMKNACPIVYKKRLAIALNI